MSSTLPRDHALEAAKLLRRLAIFIVFAAMPAVALFSRTAATIALPVAAVLMSFAILVDPERMPAGARFRVGLASPLVLVGLYGLLWLGATLAWTPFPVSSAGRYGAAVAVVAAGFLALVTLPEKMRASTLNLIPIGAFGCGLLAAGLATLALFDREPVWLRLDRAVLERGMAALCLFTFVGAAWLFSRGRRIDAIALIAVVGAAFAALGSWPSGIAFAAGLVAFLLARLAGGVAAALVIALAVLSLLVLPLWPVIASTFGPDGFGWSLREADAARAFASRLTDEWPRFLGGHGFDSLRFAQRAGIVPADLPRLPHLELWFEAGLPAALATVTGVALAARWALHARATVGAGALAALAAGIVYAAIGSPAAPRGYGLSQNWWLATVVLTVFGFASIARGQFRTRRPRLNTAS